MEMQRVLRMVGGTGDTSYATNSFLQRTSINKAKPTIERAIENLCSTCININVESILGLADLGCSSGPNALFVISFLVDAIERKQKELRRKVPEFRVFLNDLAGNDFNAIFQSLPQFYQKMREEKGGRASEPSCFIGAVPGSFYGRLFPVESLHLIHSSYSLHWLSQVPPLLNGTATNAPLNKGNIYISKSSSPIVEEAYMQQHSRDFSLFLKCRSKELVAGGKMVLTFIGRASAQPRENFYVEDCLATALKAMVLQGAIEEEKLDTFNLPVYFPSVQEIRRIVDEEGSFDVDELGIIEVDWDGNVEKEDKKLQNTRGWNVAKSIRAVFEPLLVNHFGKELNIDDLFYKFSEIVDDHMSKENGTRANLVMSLTNRGH